MSIGPTGSTGSGAVRVNSAGTPTMTGLSTVTVSVRTIALPAQLVSDRIRNALTAPHRSVWMTFIDGTPFATTLVKLRQ